jgi:hypothetical protein
MLSDPDKCPLEDEVSHILLKNHYTKWLYLQWNSLRKCISIVTNIHAYIYMHIHFHGLIIWILDINYYPQTLLSTQKLITKLIYVFEENLEEEIHIYVS